MCIACWFNPCRCKKGPIHRKVLKRGRIANGTQQDWELACKAVWQAEATDDWRKVTCKPCLDQMPWRLL